MSFLVDAVALAAALGSDRPPVLLDTRWSHSGPPGRSVYAEAHVPGAVFVDLDADLAAAPGAGGRHPLPDPLSFAAAMRRAGVTLDRPVVVMDGREGSQAARMWWLLRHHGHDDVRLLDGGLAAWVAAGGEVATGDAGARYGDDGPAVGVRFMASVARLPVLDASGAAEVARDGVLLDARAEARYLGQTEPIDPVAGHIPGAVTMPTLDLVDEDGRFLEPDVLRVLFAGVDARPGALVGVYCGSGVTASHEVLALAEAGIEAALYAGSWSEWITDPSRPVATTDR
jgi:thiosulfate/3-mercaptopyruvate sulfurtransferase